MLTERDLVTRIGEPSGALSGISTTLPNPTSVVDIIVFMGESFFCSVCGSVAA